MLARLLISIFLLCLTWSAFGSYMGVPVWGRIVGGMLIGATIVAIYAVKEKEND